MSSKVVMPEDRIKMLEDEIQRLQITLMETKRKLESKFLELDELRELVRRI